jgi:hypothetical protein
VNKKETAMSQIRSLLTAAMAAAMFAGFTAPLLAQPQRQAEWNIHGRMEQVAERINRNEARGRLSHRDARRLREELQAIGQSEQRMRSDGRLDRREREVLDRRLNKLDARISDERR